MPKTNNKTLVAVYGTLKEGHGNHRLLLSSTLITKGKTDPIYDMVSMGGFPSIISGEKSVDVEVYEVTSLVLDSLDSLEGHPHFYKRDITHIVDEDGVDLEAYIYKVVQEDSILSRPRVQTTTPDGSITWIKSIW